MAFTYLIIAVLVVLFFMGIRIVRPTRCGLVERFGKYHHFATPGFNWVIPVVDKMCTINITEAMVKINPMKYGFIVAS